MNFTIEAFRIGPEARPGEAVLTTVFTCHDVEAAKEAARGFLLNIDHPDRPDGVRVLDAEHNVVFTWAIYDDEFPEEDA